VSLQDLSLILYLITSGNAVILFNRWGGAGLLRLFFGAINSGEPARTDP
jgi:hypothetical protein